MLLLSLACAAYWVYVSRHRCDWWHRVYLLAANGIYKSSIRVVIYYSLYAYCFIFSFMSNDRNRFSLWIKTTKKMHHVSHLISNLNVAGFHSFICAYSLHFLLLSHSLKKMKHFSFFEKKTPHFHKSHLWKAFQRWRWRQRQQIFKKKPYFSHWDFCLRNNLQLK